MQPKARVLYLSYDGMTDPLGQSQVLPYLKGLSALGYEFTLVSFEKAERYEKGKAEVMAITKAVNINWVPLHYTKKPPVISTLRDLNRMQQTAEMLHSKHPFNIVHCRSYISALVGLKLKKKYGVKFVFDMRGFWADERVEGGIWNLNNPVYRLVYNYFKKKEKEFFSEADYTISLTENGKREIHTWSAIKGQPIPIMVIPCCADLDAFNYEHIDAAKLQALAASLGIHSGNYVITYLGSVGTWYMLHEMMEFFKCLLEVKPEARFLFITNDNSAHILQAATALGISAHAIIVKPAKRNEVPLFLKLGEWSLFFIKPVFSKKASSPTKQGEIMGMGIPHICNTGVGDVGEILENGNCGVAINTFNAASYRQAISQMLQGHFNPPTIRQSAFNFYSLQKGVNSYKQVYQGLGY